MIYLEDISILENNREVEDKGRYTYIGRIRKGTRTDYVFRCKICLQDPELFGNSLFYTDRTSYSKGSLFCGCAKKVTWSEDQAVVKSIRSSKRAGHIFNGIVQPYIGSNSWCNLTCSLCSHSFTSKLSNLWSLERGCRRCRDINGLKSARAKIAKTDEDMIKSFMASGSYSEDTIFKRTDKTTKNGQKVYWEFTCTVCGELVESQQGHLQKGKTGCKCSWHKQTEAYINLVKDGNEIIAIKFGISKNSENRRITHNYNTPYEIEMLCVYKFSNIKSCKDAEATCKQSLECGIIPKNMFNGGYTETTYPYNIDKIIKIYSDLGGIRII